MTYVLILMLYSSEGVFATTVEYGDRLACEAAGQSAQKAFRADYGYAMYSCSPRVSP